MNRFLLSGIAILAAQFALPADAADVFNLYEASVEPSTDRARDSAFVEAFRIVAVKVSGVRSAADKFPADIPNLRNNVQLRTVRPDGAVTIRFDESWVDRTLTAAGLPLWGRERPTTLIWLSVPDAMGRPTWLTADGQAPEKEVLERIAQRRGLPIVWPAMDVADVATASSLLTTRPSAPVLLASGERYRADAVLFGIANRDASGALSVRWSFVLQGVEGPSGDIQASLEEGVEFAADRCAALFATSANARSEVLISVLGIHSLDAYAAAMRFLEGLTPVRAIVVEELRADMMRLRIAVRGDATTLRRAVELKRRDATLVVDSTAGALAAMGAGETLQLRYLQ